MSPSKDKLDIVIACNGEKTIPSLVKQYQSFYQFNLNLKVRIVIYDSKYSESYKSLFEKNYSNVFYFDEPKNLLDKYYRYLSDYLVNCGDEYSPDFVLRATADDIFYYTNEDFHILSSGSDSWRYLVPKYVLNFEVTSIQESYGLKAQLLDYTFNLDDQVCDKNKNLASPSRALTINYYGLFNFNMYSAVILWQYSLLTSLPLELESLTEILIGIPFHGCKAFVSEKALYFNQRSPQTRNWGKVLTAPGIRKWLNGQKKPVNIHKVYENYNKLLAMNFGQKSFPESPSMWIDELLDLRFAKTISEITRCSSAWKRLGFFAWELIIPDWCNKSQKVSVISERHNKCNLKILASPNLFLEDFFKENFYYLPLSNPLIIRHIISIDNDFLSALSS